MVTRWEGHLYRNILSFCLDDSPGAPALSCSKCQDVPFDAQDRCFTCLGSLGFPWFPSLSLESQDAGQVNDKRINCTVPAAPSNLQCYIFHTQSWKQTTAKQGRCQDGHFPIEQDSQNTSKYIMIRSNIYTMLQDNSRLCGCVEMLAGPGCSLVLKRE